MKTPGPFLLRFFLPPLYAALCFGLPVALSRPVQPANAWILAVFVLFAYVYAGLPALLFALLMGRFARRRPAPGGRLTRAALLGLASGTLIAAPWGFANAVIFLPLGAFAGSAAEGTVILLERRHIVAT